MTKPDVTAQTQHYEQMLALVFGYWGTQIVRAAALYDLAGHLASGRNTPEEIAKAESTDLDATGRLMRTCASMGLLTSDDGVHYAGTPLLDTLHEDAPNSLRYVAISQAAPGHWLPWGRFPEAVRTGEPQVKAAHGDANIFDYFAGHPDEASFFTKSMSNVTVAVARDVATVLDTEGVKLAMDIGGAAGDVVRALMKANPELRGGVFDLPHIVPDAAKAAEADGLAERFTAVDGDFFEQVPPADLYVLKYILHDWDDDSCVRILKNCRSSLADGGRIAVVDHLIGRTGEPGLAPLMDMNMLDMAGGRERELGEFDALFAASGLRRVKVSAIGAFAVIEAVPAV